MTRDHITEAMNGIGEHLIVEAAEKLGIGSREYELVGV